MLFPTLDFGFFFLIVVVVTLAVRQWPGLRLWFLVGASYVFYGFWDWRFTGLLLFSTLLNYFGGLIVFNNKSKTALYLVVAANLGILGVFKYFNFFIEEMNVLLAGLGLARDLPFLSILLPVGISFFTFHGISYVVDLHRADLKRPASFGQLMLYISFFPQLVAGPIVRASHFLPQIAAPEAPRSVPLIRPLLLIAFGLFKKVVVANDLASLLVDDVFRDPSAYGAGDLLLAAYGYALQIYCDFSAYTDIAIGLAALFGYRFPQNFDQPYRADGVRDFWKRWHISLSTWLRDYLYIPLGGNRCPPWRQRLNLMLTMLLGGLWHGAAWNFVLWGGLHGAALVIEHFSPSVAGRASPKPLATLALARGRSTRQLDADEAESSASSIKLAKGLRIFLTFHFICLTWIFFRAADLSAALTFLEGFGRSSAPTLLSPYLALILFGGLAAQFLPPDMPVRIERAIERFPAYGLGLATGLVILLVDVMAPEGVAPFIYFRF
jgi:alginate O-acetyltransferase complex protein AlgI